MRTVQRGAAAQPPHRRVPPYVLTTLAILFVLLVLALPNDLEELHPLAFVRVPVEPLVLLAVLLALPRRLARLRTGLALAAGLLLGVVAVLKLLDMGFIAAMNRPFDPLIDWRYAGSLVELVRDSFGDRTGTLLLVLAGVVVVALLVLVPVAMVWVVRAAVERRRTTWRVTSALAASWLLLSVLEVPAGGDPVASRDTAGYVYGAVSRIPSELRDQREFATAARRDPLRDVPGRDLLAGLRGKDVLLVFVESYGRVALEDPSFGPGIRSVLETGNRQLEEAGFASRSAFLTSPTFGALSWLAHATLQSGLWVDSQQRYDVLVTSPRLTLSRLFGQAGWRTVADVPANTRDWPQGEFYGFDHLYDSRNVGYRGPRFGYPTMPDQYTLDAFHRLELAEAERAPVMAEIDLITSHAPWSRTPRMVDQASVGDGSVFLGMPEQLPSESDIWPSPARVREAYGEAIEYSLTALLTFITTYGDDDLVVVLLGDHQPATIVSGHDAGRDVPIAVVTRDRAVLDHLSPWGWDEGVLPSPDAPVWRMDAFRDRFVAAYSHRPPH